jgi:hypothetical protein
MTIRNLYPDIRPSLNLDFTNSKRLDSRITFTRSSTGTYTDESGIIRTAAANEARFDHDGDGNSLGLLIEESRTNLLTRSEEFDDGTAWGKVNVTVTANAAVAPDGTTTADKLSATTTNGIHSIFSVAISAGTYTFSVFAKKAEYDRIIVNYYGISFNLNTGVIESTLPWQYNTSAKIEKFANGWYRCSVTGTAAGNLYLSLANAAPAGNLSAPPSFAGDGTSGIYIWGAQLEAGSFPTSYIPTSGSTVTRSADVASMTGTNFSSWYNQSEGTLFAQWVSPDTKQFSSPAIIKESTAKNGPRIYNYAYTGNKIYALVKTTVEHAILLTSVYSPSAPLKTIIGYSASEVASTFNGNSTQTASITTAIPTMTRLDIGDVYATNDRYSNHHIARLTYYPTRLPDATLQALTL